MPLHDSKASPIEDEPDSVPPTKRRRVEGDAGAVIDRSPAQVKLEECLEKQVFPHVKSALAELPSHRCNTQAIGRLAVAGLTGGQFTDEYNHGRGRLSPAFEHELAARARSEIMRLASLPVRQKFRDEPRRAPLLTARTFRSTRSKLFRLSQSCRRLSIC